MSRSREIRLCYVSSAVEEFNKAKLHAMLEKSRDKNSAQGVTGILMYRKGTFMQILEGPEETVDATFDRIARDPRHTGVLKLLRREIESRAFPDWSMGFRELSAEESSEVKSASTASSKEEARHPLPPLIDRLIAEFKRINR